MSFWTRYVRAWRQWWLRPAENAGVRAQVHPFDRATGMDTSGMVLIPGGGEGTMDAAYYGSAPSLFRAVMERWGGEAAGATFIDLGCGKGRVLLLASAMAFSRCIGVELDPKLAATARANAARWPRARCAIEVVCADAAEFRFPAEGRCVVYLFHPFSAEVLGRVLANLEDAFRERAGELDLLYVNAEFDGMFSARPGWQGLWRMPVEMSPEDRAADLLYAEAADGGPAFAEAYCSGWRWIGTRENESQRAGPGYTTFNPHG